MNLEAAELAELRADFATHTFADLATFYREAEPSVSDMGDDSPSAAVVVTADVPCRVGMSQAQALENEAAGVTQSVLRGKLFIPYSTPRPGAAEWIIITTMNNRRLEVRGSVWVSGMLSHELDFTEVR